jgi:predicted CoA-binding protein
MTTATAITGFLAHRRIALVGVSRNPRDFTRGLLRELVRRGYDVAPVSRQGGTMEGLTCAQRVQDIVPPVEGALLVTPPAATEQVVKDCAEAGIRSVWMHRGVGDGAVSPAAVAFCRGQGMSVVEGACPYMFLPGAGFIHRVHGWLKRDSTLRSKAARPANPAHP